MTATSLAAQVAIPVTQEDLAKIRHEVDLMPAEPRGFLATTSDGTIHPLPPELSSIIDRAFRALATTGNARIGVLAENLTTTTVAGILGISRPTLLGLVKTGTIESFRVGTHARFKRKDVLAFKAKRDAARRVAMDELSEIEDQLDALA